MSSCGGTSSHLLAKMEGEERAALFTSRPSQQTRGYGVHHQDGSYQKTQPYEPLPNVSVNTHANHKDDISAPRAYTLPTAATPVIANSRRSSKLSFMCLIGYSVGHVLNDMCAACWFTYLLVFLKKVTRLSALDAGIVFFCGQGFDALATPIVGIVSDNSHGLTLGTTKLGPRKLGHLVGTVSVAITFLCVFGQTFLPRMPAGIATAYYSTAASLFNIGWATTQVNHMAMVPELSSICRDRLLLNSGRYAFTIISNLAVFISFLLCVQLLVPQRQLTAAKFGYLSLACVVVGLACSGVFQAFVPEQVGEKRRRNSFTRNFSSSWSPMPSRDPTQKCPSPAKRDGAERMHFTEWFGVPAFYHVGYVYMTTRLFTNICQVYLPLYTISTLKMGNESLGAVPMVLYVASLVYTICLEQIEGRVGRFVSFILGCAYVICASGLLGVAQHNTSWMVYVAAVLLGAGSATCSVASVAMEADLIGEQIQGGAFVFGALSFTDKLSGGIAIIVVQVLAQSLEDPSAEDPCGNLACANFIRGVLVVVPGFCAVTAVAMVVYMRLTNSLPTHDGSF